MDKKNEGFKIAHITSMIFMYYRMVKKKLTEKTRTQDCTHHTHDLHSWSFVPSLET